jgi:hypothetical protein
MIFIDWLMIYVYRNRNTWNTFPGSGQNIHTLNNSNTEQKNQIEQKHCNEWNTVGQIIGLLSWHVYSKKESWKAALCLTKKKGKRQPAREKSPRVKKERIAYSNSGWWCRREKWSQWWWWWWVRTSRADYKSMWQRFGVLRIKHQKVGLNRRHNAYTAGGGGLVLTHHLITW